MKLWQRKLQQSERQPGILLPPFKNLYPYGGGSAAGEVL